MSKLKIKPEFMRQQNLGEREKLLIKRTTYLVILKLHGEAAATKLVLQQTIFKHSLKLISRVILTKDELFQMILTISNLKF